MLSRNDQLQFTALAISVLADPLVKVKVLDVDFHAESRPEGNLYTNLYTLSMPAKMSYVDVIGTLSEHPNIRTVRTRNL